MVKILRSTVHAKATSSATATDKSAKKNRNSVTLSSNLKPCSAASFTALPVSILDLPDVVCLIPASVILLVIAKSPP